MFNIAFDCGGSSLRYIFDEAPNNQVIKRPSQFAEIPIDTEVIPELGVSSEEMIIKRNEDEPVRIIKGDALNSYKGMVYTINHVDMKVHTKAVYTNILYGITKTLLRGKVNDVIRVGMCLPPAELYGGFAAEFKERLAGHYNVTFPFMPDRTVVFDIEEDQILLQPEGICARTQIDGDKIGKFKGLTLFCDVGYRSLDIILMDNGKPVRQLAPSYPHGGHNMESELVQLFQRKGIYASQDEIVEAITTGTLQNKDVAAAVNSAKLSFANLIYTDICQMIGGLPQYTLQGVRNLVLIGRPFTTPSSYNLSDLTTLVSKYFPWMAVVRPDDLEEANVRGIYEALVKWNSKSKSQTT